MGKSGIAEYGTLPPVCRRRQSRLMVLLPGQQSTMRPAMPACSHVKNEVPSPCPLGGVVLHDSSWIAGTKKPPLGGYN